METLMNVENPWTLPGKETLFEFAISSRNMALISKKWFMEAQVFFNVEFCQNHWVVSKGGFTMLWLLCFIFEIFKWYYQSAQAVFFFSHNPCYDWGVARSSIRHCLIRVRRRLLYFVFFKISFEKDPLFCGPCDLQSPLNKSIVVRELRAKQISLILAVNQLQQGKDLAVAV